MYKLKESFINLKDKVLQHHIWYTIFHNIDTNHMLKMLLWHKSHWNYLFIFFTQTGKLKAQQFIDKDQNCWINFQ